MKSRACANCGSAGYARFEDEAFRVSYKGQSVEVRGPAGRRCAACGEIEFDAKSARRYAAAGDELVLKARESEPTEIRRIGESWDSAKPPPQS
jgi:HTH-type transcriptional regulator/antitoxin MqsA